MRVLLLSAVREPYLRLVLDDDKVHYENNVASDWGTLKRVKHVKCNRFGLTVHTLASSCTGLIFGIKTHTVDDNNKSCVQKILTSQFKDRDREFPDLRNITVAVDRGYGDDSSLMSWIVAMRGSVLGTMKRTLWAPFTWDQTKRFQSDSRIFEKTSGFRYVRKKYHQLQEGTKVFGMLVSFFFRNGFGGAVMLFSSMREHREEIWDRLEDNTKVYRDVDHSNPSSFLRPFDYSDKCSDVDIVGNRDFAIDSLRENMRFISLAQGCPEWFVLRMFCLTASSTSKSIKFMEKNIEYNVKDHWIAVRNYYKRNNNEIVETVDLNQNDEVTWAYQMLDDDDSWNWLSKEINIQSLEKSKIEALLTVISELTKRKIKRKKLIADFFSLEPEERHLVGVGKIELRKMLKELVGTNDPIFKDSKDWSGKLHVRQCFIKCFSV